MSVVTWSVFSIPRDTNAQVTLFFITCHAPDPHCPSRHVFLPMQTGTISPPIAQTSIACSPTHVRNAPFPKRLDCVRKSHGLRTNQRTDSRPIPRAPHLVPVRSSRTRPTSRRLALLALPRPPSSSSHLQPHGFSSFSQKPPFYFLLFLSPCPLNPPSLLTLGLSHLWSLPLPLTRHYAPVPGHSLARHGILQPDLVTNPRPTAPDAPSALLRLARALNAPNLQLALHQQQRFPPSTVVLVEPHAHLVRSLACRPQAVTRRGCAKPRGRLCAGERTSESSAVRE